MALEDRIRLPALNLIHRRPRLLNLLTEFTEKNYRLISIYAPGGYGKSILLADFAQTTDLPVCWCSLDTTDRDPTAFLTLLAYSITDRFHEIEPAGLFKVVQRGDTEASIRRIADLLAMVGPHLIILDDYHKAYSAGMILALNKLLELLPPTSTMIVAARGDMNLATAQIIELLITERVTGLSEEELRFTPAELQRVIRKRFGRQIDLAEAEALAQATDGNVAQILLAGHSQSLHVDRLMGHLSHRLGDDREIIYDYLAGEVFEKQSPELKRFMLHTAVLPEMTVDLCNDLLAMTEAQVYLDELVKRDLFTTQLGASFRYHDLFAEFLRGQLAHDQALYQEVSLRAARLLTARAHFEQAINLFLAVQAWAEAANLLETQGRTFYDTGRVLTLNQWLEQIPEQTLTQHPRLLLLQGEILSYDLGQPELALAYYRQAEEQFRQQNDLVGVAEAQVWQSVSLRLTGQANESLQMVTKGLGQLVELKADASVLAWATGNNGIAHLTTGNISQALASTRQALELYETIGDISGMSRSHHEIGFCLEKQGNLSGAEHHYKLALRQSSGNAYDFANTLNSLGVLLYFAGRYEEALKRFQESLDIARQVGAARRAAFAQASIADVYLDCGQYEQALKAYAASTQLAQEAGVRKLEIYNLVKTGEGYYQQGDLDQAFLLAEQAREIAAETGLVFEDGLACALQAKIYIRRAEYRASFGLFDQALAGLAGNDVLEQGRARLWWGYGLLLDLRPMAAFKQLQEAIKLAMGMGEMRHGLRPVVTETRQLLLHFLYRADTAAGLRESLSTLLRLSQEPLSTLKPGLQVFAFGSPLLIVSGMQRRFVQRGGIRKAPEFLLYLLIEGREVGCRWSEVSEAIWPDLEPDKASSLFHQTLRRLRDTIFESPDYIIRQDDYYRLNPDYLEWCDALTFDTLYERAARAAPEEALALQLELIDLYQGEFLAGFELGEWGTAYRASCEIRFLQMVKLASEQLLRAGLPQETLTIINKGLALDQFREDLHRAALNAYAQLGLYDRLTAHYDVLRATFEHELGAPPEPATQQLYAQLIGSK